MSCGEVTKRVSILDLSATRRNYAKWYPIRTSEISVQTAAMRYFIQSGIPTFSAADAAIDFVLRIAREAQANSVAKIPKPASKTNIPGPGAKRKTVPTMVMSPPTTPIKIRHTNEPYGVFLICWRIFTALDYPISTHERSSVTHLIP